MVVVVVVGSVVVCGRGLLVATIGEDRIRFDITGSPALLKIKHTHTHIHTPICNHEFGSHSCAKYSDVHFIGVERGTGRGNREEIGDPYSVWLGSIVGLRKTVEKSLLGM